MVSPGINVADFKEKVKEKKKPRLDNWAADELLVYSNWATYNNGLGQPMRSSASLAGLGGDDGDQNVVVVVVPSYGGKDRISTGLYYIFGSLLNVSPPKSAVVVRLKDE